jgi:hypothetical protein
MIVVWLFKRFENKHLRCFLDEIKNYEVAVEKKTTIIFLSGK